MFALASTTSNVYQIAWKLDWEKEQKSAICIKWLSHDPRTGETSVQVNNDVKSDGTAANGPSLYCMDPICEARPMLRGWETLRCCKLGKDGSHTSLSWTRSSAEAIRECTLTLIWDASRKPRWGAPCVVCRIHPNSDCWNPETRQTGWTSSWVMAAKVRFSIWVGGVDCQPSSSAIDRC